MNSTEQVPVWEPRDTVNECTVSLAEMFPGKELFVFYHKGQRDSYTALTLYTLAGRFADRLRRHGFQRQDVIANTLPNSPERVITDLGIILAGCITMNLQHLLVDGSDLYHTARKSGCKCVIMSDNEQCPTWQLLKPYIAGDTDNFITSISIDHTPEITSSIVVTRNRTGPKIPLLEDLTNSDEEVFVDKVSPSDLAVIFGTSGSTGYSKLVPRTHADTVNCLLMRDVVWYRKTYGQSVKITMYSDRLLGWIGGFSFYSTVAAVTRVLKDSYTLDESTASQDFWDAVTNEDCTFAIMAPLEVEKRISHITSSGGVFHKKLKYLIVIGQPMTKEQVKKTFLLSESVFVGYGSTEVSSIAGITVQEDNYESYNCGKPSKENMVRVVDDRNGLCKPKEVGTIQVKGERVFSGYYNKLEHPDPDTLKAFTEDGWFNLEDCGYLDNEGNVFVLGRNKDTITYGAAVVYPGWLEDQISLHPDVILACVVPVSDPVLFHNICACVKLSSTSTVGVEEIKSFCEQRFLPNLVSAYTPRPAFYLIFKEDFPELKTGKPDRLTLKSLAEEQFGYQKEHKV